MNVRQSAKPQKRIAVQFNSSWRIQSYDSDNLYPQNIRQLVAVSSTATTCLNRYADFLEGNGLHSQELSDHVINRRGETMDEIHHMVCQDKAMFNGFALHINYDATLRPCEITHVPFENCRLEEADSMGYVAHICVHPDWSGQMTLNGKKVRPSDDTIDRIDVFNPDPMVVAMQVEAAGGFDSYKGQILYVTGDGMRYPLAIFDSVLTDISTDEGLSNVKLRNVRNNFLPAGAFVHYAAKDGTEDDITMALASVQGDMRSNKIMDIEIESPEEKPEFMQIPVANYDKAFDTTTADTKDNIYSIFGQEGWLCLRAGKVGFGGDVVRDIELQYAKRCARTQRELSKAYLKVLSHFDPATMPLIDAESLYIEPLTTINTEGGQQ